MTPAVSVRNLVIRYGDFRAVDDVSFELTRGEVFGLLGPNGSGKTTIIKALCGLIPVAGGDARVLDIDVRARAAEVRYNVGYMSQKFGLYEDLTARENIEFYSGVYGLEGEHRKRRFDEVIQLTLLGPYLDRRASQLSGGWKQRLALACAIVHEPEVVFLDEPTAGIDPVARRALWDLVFRLSSSGVTFLVTTHYMDEAERCGRVGYLYLSHLIALGSVDELRSSPETNPPGTLRLEVDAPAGALAVVDKLGYVRESTLFGRRMHLMIDEAAGVERLSADLERAGVGAAQIVPIEPSLEDVFVTLTRRKQAELAR
ncbi:MAG: ABC transporter ATP-binding protein [Bryobacteraceae bacterium]